MIGNLLYFGPESEGIEVREFQNKETIEDIIIPLIPDVQGVEIGGILPKMYLHDFDEFEDGFYEYIFLFEKNSRKEKKY